RRHTRWPRDWSSDVCSSDLRDVNLGYLIAHCDVGANFFVSHLWIDKQKSAGDRADSFFKYCFHNFRVFPRVKFSEWQESFGDFRSEERRVGKERRCRRETTS